MLKVSLRPPRSKRLRRVQRRWLVASRRRRRAALGSCSNGKGELQATSMPARIESGSLWLVRGRKRVRRRHACAQGHRCAALYRVLFELLRLQGFYVAHAGITLPNPGSVALHASFGFESRGRSRAHSRPNARRPRVAGPSLTVCAPSISKSLRIALGRRYYSNFTSNCVDRGPGATARKFVHGNVWRLSIAQPTSAMLIPEAVAEWPPFGIVHSVTSLPCAHCV